MRYIRLTNCYYLTKSTPNRSDQFGEPRAPLDKTRTSAERAESKTNEIITDLQDIGTLLEANRKKISDWLRDEILTQEQQDAFWLRLEKYSLISEDDAELARDTFFYIEVEPFEVLPSKLIANAFSNFLNWSMPSNCHDNLP
jgi:hypothetical protein